MAPIRVGIVGLKAVVQDDYTPGTWGLQHLKALSASPHYEIVAVCNNTLESAQKSIDLHMLHNAKPYSKAEDLAADPNVDMVLVSVNIFSHFQPTKTALLHNKHVYVEYPVAPTVEEVEELAHAAAKHGVKVVAGAQSLADPVFSRMRELVHAGEIGDLVSTTLTGAIPFVTADGWPHANAPFLDGESGISRGRAVPGHVLSIFTSVVGHFAQVQSALKVQDKVSPTVDDEGNVVNPAYPTTAPDTIFFQGILENGALASLCIRSIRPAADDTGIRWVISGTKGELEYTSPPGIIQYLDGASIRIRKWGSGAEVVDVSPDEAEHIKALKQPAVNLGRTWEAFAKGDMAKVLSIEDALKVHELVEKINREAIHAP